MGVKEIEKTLQLMNWVRISLTSKKRVMKDKKSVMKVICALKTPTCILEQEYKINKQNKDMY